MFSNTIFLLHPSCIKFLLSAAHRVLGLELVAAVVFSRSVPSMKAVWPRCGNPLAQCVYNESGHCLSRHTGLLNCSGLRSDAPLSRTDPLPRYAGDCTTRVDQAQTRMRGWSGLTTTWTASTPRWLALLLLAERLTILRSIPSVGDVNRHRAHCRHVRARGA